MSNRQIYIERIHMQGMVRSVLPLLSLRTLITEWVSDEDLKYLVRNCPNLTTLFMKTKAVTGVGLKYIADSCPQLERFCWDRESLGSRWSFEQQTGTTAMALVDILHQCSKLKMVWLAGDTMQLINLEEIRRFGHLFVKLSLGVAPDAPNPTAVFQAISALLRNCCNLTKLELLGKRFAVDIGPSFVTAQSCPLLVELCLRRLPSVVAYPVLAGFSHRCKLLKNIKLMGCDLSESSLRVVAGMTNVKYLAMEYCKGLTDTFVASLARLSLVSLKISDSQDANRLTAESFQTYVAGANICQSLESVYISIVTERPVDADEIVSAFALCRQLKTARVHVMTPRQVIG